MGRKTLMNIKKNKKYYNKFKRSNQKNVFVEDGRQRVKDLNCKKANDNIGRRPNKLIKNRTKQIKKV